MAFSLTSAAMEDFPARLADFLESVATRIRAATVDRVAKVIKIVASAMAALTLALVAAVFLFMTLQGALALLWGDAAAYGILAGVFLVAALFAWRKRISRGDEA